MSLELEKPFRILPQVMNYSWGKKGESLVRELAHAKGGEPYAELWYGAHPKAPSVLENGSDLRTLIQNNRNSILGDSPFTGLPFLFKVLSVGQPLSIQAHPDKALAALLNSKDCINYPDSNHKPEIGVAVTRVSLLYGFREISEISETLIENRELRALLTENTRIALEKRELNESSQLRAIYSDFILSDCKLRAQQMELMFVRLESSSRSWHQELFLSLARNFGFSDIGLPSLFLLNAVELNPGEGIFIGPNIAHAYLSGDLLECMTSSDNVVRAGLTHKFQDIKTLLSMLEFRVQKPQKLLPEPITGSTQNRYQTSADEFEVRLLSNSKGEKIVTGEKPEMLFCLSGDARINYQSGQIDLKRGDCLFVPASLSTYSLDFVSGELFRIMTNYSK